MDLAISTFKPISILFTGLPASGKTTVATALKEALEAKKYGHVSLLDGDVLRADYSVPLGFSKMDRLEHNHRVSLKACDLLCSGHTVLTALISPFQIARTQFRAQVESFGFSHIEVYLNTPLEICQKRDQKGLYKRALNKEIIGLTGVDSPYEVPESPSLVLDPSKQPPSDCVNTLLSHLFNAIQ